MRTIQAVELVIFLDEKFQVNFNIKGKATVKLATEDESEYERKCEL